MFEIIDLHAAIDGKEILNGRSLSVNAGEVQAIMGPNCTNALLYSSVHRRI